MRRGFFLSLPERFVRSLAAVVGGGLHETAQLVLPRLVRESRLYEATAKNLLRVTIELVGRVPQRDAALPAAGEVAVRKGAGNVVELGSIAAFGFSPLWLLAAASDVAHGSRTYLSALTAELKAAGVLAQEAQIRSVDELLSAFERGSATAAALVDVPPLELAELRRSVAELRESADSLPGPGELAAAFAALRAESQREGRSLLEVSQGIGLAFLLSARIVGREHLVVPYREDWRPLRDEGFAAYARRVAGPYREAVAGHLDEERPTFTERILGRLSRDT
ncbi:MAG TPA: hypothetical protein VLB86_08145 [Gaiellaceae bacterium]|nr:hypothetical protein [Gaiellaceae bacterium]